MVPGTKLLRLARSWFDATTVSRVFEPLIADWQREYGTAASAQWLCRLRGVTAFCWAFALVVMRELPRAVPRFKRALLLYTAFVVLSSALMLLPYGDMLVTSPATLLIPSSLALGLPLALVPAAMWLAATRGYQAHEARRALVQLTACVLLAQMLLVGWITPIANQMWREDVFARRQKQGLRAGSAARGERELTVVELFRNRGRDAIAPPRARAREKHARVIVALSPLIMATVGLLLARRGRESRLRIVAAWVGVPATWFVVSSVAEASVKTGSPPVLLWTTPVVLLAIASVLRHIGDGDFDESPLRATTRR
jgi:hypothetical protein